MGMHEPQFVPARRAVAVLVRAQTGCCSAESVILTPRFRAVRLGYPVGPRAFSMPCIGKAKALTGRTNVSRGYNVP